MRTTQRARVAPGAALGLALLAACATNPVTGERQLALISEAQEIEIGREAAAQIPATLGLVDDEELQHYVARVGLELARQSERPELPWSFGAVDDPTPNAFALPGGFIFVTRGLLGLMNSEAQLASVLGHEIGHVTAEHIGEQMGQQLILEGVLTGLGVAVSNTQWAQVLGVGAEAGGTVYLLKFGRDQESEADELGLRYMAELNYNPLGQVQVMRILEEAGQGASRPPEWLSTHPEPGTRIERLEKIIPRQFPNYDKPDGRFRFGEESFEQNVLSRLRQLPPPQHNPK